MWLSKDDFEWLFNSVKDIEYYILDDRIINICQTIDNIKINRKDFFDLLEKSGVPEVVNGRKAVQR